MMLFFRQSLWVDGEQLDPKRPEIGNYRGAPSIAQRLSLFGQVYLGDHEYRLVAGWIGFMLRVRRASKILQLRSRSRE